MSNNEKVLLGVLAGVAVGATLGILFAPDKGLNTRNKISAKGNDYAEGLEDQFNTFIESITHKFEQLKTEAEMTAKRVKDKTNEVIARSNAVTTI